MTKEMVISVESPVADLGNVAGGIWPAVAPLVLRHIRASSTTLVFVNNRAQAEKIAARVNALAEEEIALPYHGSLARERRFTLEERLKAGSLRALITTSSLELGIDIGSVDLVIQLQSPKRVASALQRIGRAGHTLGVPSRGILVPTFRDDAVEIAAIVAAMRGGEVEPTHVVQNALDVLAQVIVAAVSVDDWRSEDLFRLVRRSYPYHQLTRSAFDEVLAMLSGKYPSEIAAELDPLSNIIHEGGGYLMALQRRYPEAIEAYRRITRLDPTGYKAYTSMGRCHALAGQYPEALAMLQKGRGLTGDVPSILAAMAHKHAAH